MNFFGNLTLCHRLALGFGAVLTLLAAMATVCALTLDQARIQGATMVSALDAVNAADRWVGMSRLNVNRTLAIVQSADSPAVKTLFSPLIKASSNEISALQRQLEADASSDAQRTLFSDIAAKRKAYMSMRDGIFQSIDSGQEDAMKQVSERLIPSSDAYLSAIGNYVAAQRRIVESLRRSGTAMVDRTRWLLTAISVMSVGLGVLCAVLITRSVTTPLRRALAAVSAMAQGNLTTQIEVGRLDEVGELLQGLCTMRDRLCGLIGSVCGSAETIRQASQEVAQGSLDLATRTELAAASLRVTASSVEQISGNVKQTADSATVAGQLAAEAAAVATAGGEVVSRMMKTMEQISGHSDRIADIIGVIDGIAFQTNILALNAAVEAARVGEHGRGFAVVASEVRGLAQRSGAAAKEIRALIAGSAEAVKSGSVLVNGTGQSMDAIGIAVGRVSEMVHEIQTASKEQLSGSLEANRSMVQLDQNTQQNAALVEQTAAAASKLKDQGNALSEAMTSFTVR